MEIASCDLTHIFRPKPFLQAALRMEESNLEFQVDV
jgi:hypothetical protein